jgi:putative transposase
MGVSPTKFCVWKKRFAGMGVADVRKTKQLEDEVRRLKQLVADLSLDKQMLQEALPKKDGEAHGQAPPGRVPGGTLPREQAKGLRASTLLQGADLQKVGTPAG